MMMKKMIIRMKKIFNLVKELSNKTDDEWVELYKKLKPILLYNRERLLKNYQKIQIFSLDKYLEKLKTLNMGIIKKIILYFKKRKEEKERKELYKKKLLNLEKETICLQKQIMKIVHSWIPVEGINKYDDQKWFYTMTLLSVLFKAIIW